MLKGFVIVLVLMPFSNKKSTIDLQRKDVYKSSAVHFKEVLSQKHLAYYFIYALLSQNTLLHST